MPRHSRRPKLRKRTREETQRFWQSYAQQFTDANNSVTSGRSALPVPIITGIGSGDDDVWNNGTSKRERTVFRDVGEASSDEYRDRERAAVAEAQAKARRIAPLFNKGAYQLITEGDLESLSNDGRGKK